MKIVVSPEDTVDTRSSHRRLLGKVNDALEQLQFNFYRDPVELCKELLKIIRKAKKTL